MRSATRYDTERRDPPTPTPVSAAAGIFAVLRRVPTRPFVWLLLIVSAVLVAVPLVFMFTASFMPANDILRMPYRWIPNGLHWRNYLQALRGNDGSWIFIRNILNSFAVASAVTVSTVLLASFTGYGLSKFRFRGRTVVFMLIMATMMIPFEAIMVPLYLVATRLGLQNSYGGLIVPFLVSAFGIFLMRQFLSTFPNELLDATRIDGAGELRIFFRVILPNCVPAIATLAVLTFRSQWDNLLWPLLIVQSEEMKTIPLYIVKFAAEKHSDEGAMMAVAAIASVPMLVLFFSLSRYFVGGAGVYDSRKG
jgi:multiple sugar transport system permease protein